MSDYDILLEELRHDVKQELAGVLVPPWTGDMRRKMSERVMDCIRLKAMQLQDELRVEVNGIVVRVIPIESGVRLVLGDLASPDQDGAFV